MSTFKSVWVAVAILSAFGGCVFGGAASADSPQETQARQANEMSRLSFLLGEWSYVNEYAGGGKDEGTYSARLGPGGHSVITEFSGHGAAGNYSALEIFTWNSASKQYEGYSFISLAPGSTVRQGNWEGDALVFYAKAGAREFRYVYKFEQETLVIEVSMRMGDQPFAQFLTTRARKIVSRSN